MNALSFQNRFMLESNYGIVLCRSCTASGEPFFHYVMADRRGIEQMHRDYTSGNPVDFSSYGKIVLSGWGENPAPEYELILNALLRKKRY
jgi:hypothetical protein